MCEWRVTCCIPFTNSLVPLELNCITVSFKHTVQFHMSGEDVEKTTIII